MLKLDPDDPDDEDNAATPNKNAGQSMVVGGTQIGVPAPGLGSDSGPGPGPGMVSNSTATGSVNESDPLIVSGYKVCAFRLILNVLILPTLCLNLTALIIMLKMF